MKASPSALCSIALHLEAVSKNVHSHSGNGWTYDREVAELNAAAIELESLRNAGRALLAHPDSVGAKDQMRKALTE
jgi:hypothetical protein